MKKINKLLKSEIKNPFGDKVCYIACFFISLFIICLIFIIKKVVPFGNNTLLDSDFYYQYSVMLAEIRDRILSNSDKIYSFRSGLGLPLYRNFINYISSPINIISIFFPRDRFMMSFSFIIGLKVVLSSCFMLWYLNSRKEKNSFSNIPFAILYAFSGYFSNYFINIMWTDSMMLLPLIAIGIDNIVKNKKWIMYCVVLTITIFANYYTGYMICVFACLYFIYSFIINTEFKFNKKYIIETISRLMKVGIIFTLSSIFAALLCITPIMLIKTSISTLDASNGEKEFQTEFRFDINARDIVFSHFNGAHRTLYYSDDISVPSISVGVLSIFFVIAFLINKKISAKEKIMSIFLLAFYFAAFFVPRIDFVLHAFHEPNDFPYRYAFIYSFIFIMISARSLDKLKQLNYSTVLIIFSLLMGLFIWYGRQMNNEEDAVLNNTVLIYNIAFLAIYTAIIVFGKYFNMNKIVELLLIMCVCIEIILMYNDKWEIDQDITDFINDYNELKPVVENINKNDDEKFFRMDKLNYLSLNDGSWNRYNGVTIFSSMAYDKLSEFQYAFGIPGNGSYSYIYNDTSPLYNLLFDVKYVLDDFQIKNDDYSFYYEEKEIESKIVNKFKYTAGIGFAVDYDARNIDFHGKNPFIMQNNIVKMASDVENDIFIPTKVEVKEIHSDEKRTICEYTIDSTNDVVYFYPESYDIDFIKIGGKIYVDDYSDTLYENYSFIFPNIKYEEDHSYDDRGIIKIGTGGLKTSIFIAYRTKDYSGDALFYTFDKDVFQKFYKEVKDEELRITDFKESKIDATIKLNKDALVYTSVPYDEGWSIYVDGNEVDTYSIAESLLCFYADEGEHEVRMEYKIPYIQVLILANVCAIILFLFICYRKNKNVK